MPMVKIEYAADEKTVFGVDLSLTADELRLPIEEQIDRFYRPALFVLIQKIVPDHRDGPKAKKDAA